MIYNSESPLSEEEINSLSEDDLFEYLDSKSVQLRKNSRPLDNRMIKTFLIATNGSVLSKDDEKMIKEIGHRKK